jgi:xanthine dehydrogenase large subunit
MPTSTEKNNNTSPTAASSGTDLNGFATLNACKKLKERLVEFAGEGMEFEVMVKKAAQNRISLGERGFYKTPRIEFDWNTGKGTPFYYYTCGCAVSEVEIDCYTGDIKLIRTDILMDIGSSINPGLDRGQITGAFVQAVGWLTLEELKYSPDGMLLTTSPSSYKIPSIHDLPDILNISFLENKENTKNIAGSKAVGEPPFMLGISVFCAIKNALAYVDRSLSAKLSAPATAEKILMLLSHAK